MSRGPYVPTPQVAARNAAKVAVLDLIESLVEGPGHGYKARVRLASLYPPPAIPTEDQVREVVDATAPPPDEVELARAAWNARLAERSEAEAS